MPNIPDHLSANNADGTTSVLTVTGDEHASYYAEDGTGAPVDYDAGACDGSSRGVGHTEHDFSPVEGGCCRNAAGVRHFPARFPPL